MLKASCVVTAAACAVAASGTVRAQTPLPPDIDPVSLSRLPPLTRADLDADGQAVYDRWVGDKPAPKTGPPAVMLYSPKAENAFEELNGYLRYNGALSARLSISSTRTSSSATGRNRSWAPVRSAKSCQGTMLL